MKKKNPKKDISEIDIVVVGSGAAGLLFALEASKNQNVLILTKSSIQESNTKYAQGGIAAVLKLDDDYDQHIRDTLVAGDGMCALDAVKILVREAPARIRELIDLGIEFDRDKDNALLFTREGGHSSRRILHVGDLTGLVIEKSLVGSVLKNKNISVLENILVLDLIIENNHCCGVVYLDTDGDIKQVLCKSAVLATGGAGQLFSRTTNPAIATGDGLAIAHRAGANIVNMEFIQFHPTAFHAPPAPCHLISEAVRGEGGIILNDKGERFMKRYHPMKELAPRDIVTRAIFNEIKAEGSDHVFLDISFKDADYLKRRFPTIYQKCREFGVDITQQPIPVSPAAHYICGGVKTNIDGMTNILGLYAIGEVACTGVHGANRLASNSLLESVVFAFRSAVNADMRIRFNYPGTIIEKSDDFSYQPPWPGGNNEICDENLPKLRDAIAQMKEVMWTQAGIIRTNKGLKSALGKIKRLDKKITNLIGGLPLTLEIVEAKNLVTVARIVLLASTRRKFNAGTHYNSDLTDVEKPSFDKQIHDFL